MKLDDWLHGQAQKMPVMTGPPDGADRIVARVRVRVRRRRLGAFTLVAATAGAAVWGLVMFSSSSPPKGVAPSSTATAVPADAAWVDKPGVPFDPTNASWHRWRPCAGGDISATAGRQGAWHGNAAKSVTLTNTSTTDCVLRGAPQITAVAPSGAQAVDPGRFADQDVPLAVGADALVAVGAPAACEPMAKDLARTLQLSIGTETPRSLDAQLPLTCGPPSLLNFEATDEPLTGGALSKLQAEWQGPNTAQAGATIDYVIALHNPTGADIALNPCPSYTQGAGGVAMETLLLNCEAVPVMKAGETKTFAMRIALPQTEAPQLKVGWHLEVEGGTSTGTVLDLR